MYADIAYTVLIEGRVKDLAFGALRGAKRAIKNNPTTSTAIGGLATGAGLAVGVKRRSDKKKKAKRNKSMAIGLGGGLLVGGAYAAGRHHKTSNELRDRRAAAIGGTVVGGTLAGAAGYEAGKHIGRRREKMERFDKFSTREPLSYRRTYVNSKTNT